MKVLLTVFFDCNGVVHQEFFQQDLTVLTTFNDDEDLFKKVITGNESWVYGYDIETKVQSLQWKRQKKTRPKKELQYRSNMKALLTVPSSFLPQGHAVNKEYYLEVMRRLCEAIPQKTHRIVEKPIMD